MTTSAARHATAATVIPADPDQVFALLTDIDRLPSWNTEPTTVLERPDELVPARNGSSRCTPPA
jgi:uncharacterized protein YndB with AHSA1/START domain